MPQRRREGFFRWIHRVEDQALFVPRRVIRFDALHFRPVQFVPGLPRCRMFDQSRCAASPERISVASSQSFAKTGMLNSRVTASAVLLLPVPGRPVKTMNCTGVLTPSVSSPC